MWKDRRTLPHQLPQWIDGDATFFVTICAAVRGQNQLAVEPRGRLLLQSIEVAAERGQWTLHICVLMPDHLHLLLSGRDPAPVVRQWKRYTARQYQVRWQRDFFEHRLRGDESFHARADYLRQNPVRAGLVASSEAWPYLFDSRQGRPR